MFRIRKVLRRVAAVLISSLSRYCVVVGVSPFGMHANGLLWSATVSCDDVSIFILILTASFPRCIHKWNPLCPGDHKANGENCARLMTNSRNTHQFKVQPVGRLWQNDSGCLGTCKADNLFPEPTTETLRWTHGLETRSLFWCAYSCTL